MNDHRLDRAVAPNLFDVIVDPELVFTLITANLMSSRLWALRERILGMPDIAQEGAMGSDERIQQVLDHHFEHVTPARIAELNGVLDLDALAERYGAAAIDYAQSRILATFDWRIKRGTLSLETLAIDLIAQRKFPAYTYATIDEAWAYRRLLQRRKHKPLGLTCCLDEAAIFSALHLTMAEGSLDDIAILGSPSHYTVLVSSAERTSWFYSKHELLSPSAWLRLVIDTCSGNGQLAFDDRLPDFDRIITASGSYSLTTAETSIPEPQLKAILARIDGFFGFRPAQLVRALESPLRPVEGSGAARVVEEASSASSADEVRKRVRHAAFKNGNVPALRALYAFRTLDLPDPSIYLQSARRSGQIDDLLPGVRTLSDAIGAVAAIAGSDSIFEDPDRIAMPDETARFATGTDRDKGLLLHVMLERAPGINDTARAGLELLISEADSFVRNAQFCISLSRMALVSGPEGRIIYRIADPVRAKSRSGRETNALGGVG